MSYWIPVDCPQCHSVLPDHKMDCTRGHYCPEWDYDFISYTGRQMDACICFPGIERRVMGSGVHSVSVESPKTDLDRCVLKETLP